MPKEAKRWEKAHSSGGGERGREDQGRRRGKRRREGGKERQKREQRKGKGSRGEKRRWEGRGKGRRVVEGEKRGGKESCMPKSQVFLSMVSSLSTTTLFLFLLYFDRSFLAGRSLIGEG